MCDASTAQKIMMSDSFRVALFVSILALMSSSAAEDTGSLRQVLPGRVDGYTRNTRRNFGPRYSCAAGWHRIDFRSIHLFPNQPARHILLCRQDLSAATSERAS